MKGLENKTKEFLEKNKNSFNPPLENIEYIINKTKEKGDFILLLNNNDIIACLGYHIYENFIQNKHNIIFIDLMLIDKNFRKNFLILNKLKLKFAEVIKKNNAIQIQTVTHNKNTYLINMYSKLAYKTKAPKNNKEKTLFFIKPEKFL